jgi:hypothetical protein
MAEIRYAYAVASDSIHLTASFRLFDLCTVLLPLTALSLLVPSKVLQTVSSSLGSFSRSNRRFGRPFVVSTTTQRFIVCHRLQE